MVWLRFVSPEFVRDSAELALAEMIRGGTTAFNDMYFFPEALAEVTDRVGVRASLAMVLFDFPTSYATDVESYIGEACVWLCGRGCGCRLTWMFY